MADIRAIRRSMRSNRAVGRRGIQSQVGARSAAADGTIVYFGCRSFTADNEDGGSDDGRSADGRAGGRAEDGGMTEEDWRRSAPRFISGRSPSAIVGQIESGGRDDGARRSDRLSRRGR